jgi:hypothetical protein
MTSASLRLVLIIRMESPEPYAVSLVTIRALHVAILGSQDCGPGPAHVEVIELFPLP